mgnify:CR=1 FL=1
MIPAFVHNRLPEPPHPGTAHAVLQNIPAIFPAGVHPGVVTDNPKDRQYFTPLKRVDRSVYHYLNLNAYASILGVLKGKEQKYYAEKAEKVKHRRLRSGRPHPAPRKRTV